MIVPGRWSIQVRNGSPVHTPVRMDATNVPVVPCDDAAVERAARALAIHRRLCECAKCWDEHGDRMRSDAVAVLRAAAEMPAGESRP